MSFAPVINFLSLPLGTMVNQRVPKKMLAEQGACAVGDRKKILDGIEEISWLAALKSNNIGVPVFRDDVREYLEIAVIAASFRAEAKSARLTEIIHRSIPYPVVLVAVHSGKPSLSLAHKRWSQGESGKVVIEKIYCSAPLKAGALTEQESSFLASLSLSSMPRGNMFSLYQGWIDRIAALEASGITGIFSVPMSMDLGSALRDGLENYSKLWRDIATLRVQAEKEKQIKRRVELNLEIKRLEAEVTAAAKML